MNKSYVLNANRMVILLSLLFSVAYCRGVRLFMEQPCSTVLHYFPPMSTIIKHCLQHKVLTYMGKFGAESAKPVLIWSSVPEVMQLKRKRPVDLDKLTIKDGDRVTGINSKLRHSQAYPPGFGEAVAQVCNMLHNTCNKYRPATPLSAASSSSSSTSVHKSDHIDSDDCDYGQHHLVY
jgi:hypothetical protein